MIFTLRPILVCFLLILICPLSVYSWWWKKDPETNSIDNNLALVDKIDKIGIWNDKIENDCKKRATRNLGGCEKLEQLSERETKKYAIKLTECDMLSANIKFPIECAGNDFNVDKCVESIIFTGQFWTSYSGYLRDVSSMCSSISFSIQKDILVEFSNNMSRKFANIVESINDYVERIRAEEIRLPKLKVFFNDFESKLKNSENTILQMNFTMNNYLSEMNEKMNINFENLDQSTISLLKELASFKERIEMVSKSLGNIFDEIDERVDGTLNKLIKIDQYITKTYDLLVLILEISKKAFTVNCIVLIIWIIKRACIILYRKLRSTFARERSNCNVEVIRYDNTNGEIVDSSVNSNSEIIRYSNGGIVDSSVDSNSEIIRYSNGGIVGSSVNSNAEIIRYTDISNGRIVDSDNNNKVIIELFRDVLFQLRERSRQKEEQKKERSRQIEELTNRLSEIEEIINSERRSHLFWFFIGYFCMALFLWGLLYCS